MMRITLPYPPSVNHAYEHTARGVRRTPRYNQFLNDCAILCLADRVQPLSGPIRAHINLYRPKRIGDIDNPVKAIFDGLQGFAFMNDDQVIEFTVRRFDDRRSPRAEVEILPFCDALTSEEEAG